MLKFSLFIALMLAPGMALAQTSASNDQARSGGRRPARGSYSRLGWQKSALERRGFILSSTAYWTAVFADLKTSKGLREGNPLLRNSSGEINVKRFVVFSAVPYAVSLWLDRKHHSKAANILQFVLAGAHGGAAVWNVTR